MGRLIDADKFYKDIANKLEWLMGYGDDVYLAVGGNISCAIAEQSTAYDPDKVVEQLKEEKELSYADFGEYVNGVCPCLDSRDDDLFHRGLERAIEIVKAGGTDAEH